MKRDMNLVREILIWTESQEHGFVKEDPVIEGFSKEEINYHVYLMRQAGLVDAEVNTHMGDESPSALLQGLTWYGHDFLSAAKDNTIWKKATNTILKRSANITFEALFEWLKIEVRQKIGLP
jgi:hypothetical protein